VQVLAKRAEAKEGEWRKANFMREGGLMHVHKFLARSRGFRYNTFSKESVKSLLSVLTKREVTNAFC
jgi:hypothetical protein